MPKPLGKNGAFVLGPARCGSTMVSEILNLHPDVLSVSEFIAMQGTRSLLPGKISGAAYWKQLSKQTPAMRLMLTPETALREFLYRTEMGRFPIDDVPPLLAGTLPMLSDDPDALFDALATTVPNQPRQAVEAHHEMAFERLMELCGGRVWVERSGLSLRFARVLPRLFPAAKFVMLYRDGRDVALSLRAFKPVRGTIWMWSWFRKLGADPIDLEHPIGRSRNMRLREQVSGPAPLIRWMLNHPPPLKACAEFWSDLTLRTLPEFLALPSERRHVVRYEDLTAEPRAALLELAKFLAVETPEDWLAKAVRIPKTLEPRWKRLEPAVQKDLTDWTAEAREAVDRKLA